MNYDPHPNTPRGEPPVLCWGHGMLPKQKGVVTYELSANQQRPLAGALRNALFNTARRSGAQFFYVVPPLVAAYMLMDWAEKKNQYLNSKAGRLASEDDVS